LLHALDEGPEYVLALVQLGLEAVEGVLPLLGEGGGGGGGGRGRGVKLNAAMGKPGGYRGISRAAGCKKLMDPST
jgi:hypothetical protein